MTNYSEEIKRFNTEMKNAAYIIGRHLQETPWLFVVSMTFGILLNTVVHSYFNGFTNTLMLMVDHPLAFGLAPCVYGKTPYWAFLFIVSGSFIIGYYSGRAYYQYRFRRLFNQPNWGE
tara:strand:+ start:1206 stop:1559 length:354 start_codon:yes stop_codon:yes gene_type:complete